MNKVDWTEQVFTHLCTLKEFSESSTNFAYYVNLKQVWASGSGCCGLVSGCLRMPSRESAESLAHLQLVTRRVASCE